MDHIIRNRRRRKSQVRIRGSKERPRVSVFRSNAGMYVQIIDDEAGRTLLASRVMIGKSKGKQNSTDQIAKMGKDLAAAAKKKGVKQVVFDRGGYKYHGRIKALAEAMREGGLQF